MITHPSTSYPFLAIAQRFQVPYARVLHLAQQYEEKGFERLNSGEDLDLSYSVHVAIEMERARRLGVKPILEYLCKPILEYLCKDEGCDHFGTPHVCVWCRNLNLE